MFEICLWSKFNLACYFYKNGNVNANIEKDLNLAIKLLEDASKGNIILASIELLKLYVDLYIASGRQDINLKNKIDFEILQIQKNKEYNNEMKINIENILSSI